MFATNDFDARIGGWYDYLHEFDALNIEFFNV